MLLLEAPEIHLGLAYLQSLQVRLWSPNICDLVAFPLPCLHLLCPSAAPFEGHWQLTGLPLADWHAEGKSVVFLIPSQKKREHLSQSPHQSFPPTPPPESGHVHASANHRSHRNIPTPQTAGPTVEMEWIPREKPGCCLKKGDGVALTGKAIDVCPQTDVIWGA